MRLLHANVRSVGDARLLLEVLQAGLLTWILLRRRPLVAALQIGKESSRRFSQQDAVKAARFADALVRRLAARNPCINRSISLYRLLRRHGLAVTFHAGLHRNLDCSVTEALRGHAWLSLDGQPYLEPQAALLSQFHETFRYPRN